MTYFVPIFFFFLVCILLSVHPSVQPSAAAGPKSEHVANDKVLYIFALQPKWFCDVRRFNLVHHTLFIKLYYFDNPTDTSDGHVAAMQLSPKPERGKVASTADLWKKRSTARAPRVHHRGYARSYPHRTRTQGGVTFFFRRSKEIVKY